MDMEKPLLYAKDEDLSKKLVEAINVPAEEFANFAKQTIDLEGLVFD
jgi:hypothetical protein